MSSPGDSAEADKPARMHAFTERTELGLQCCYCGTPLDIFMKVEPRPTCEQVTEQRIKDAA